MKLNCCSVIVTYNRKELLCRSLEKNLEQTAGQDIIIIDNASTDGTKELLDKKGFLSNSRVHYHRN